MGRRTTNNMEIGEINENTGMELGYSTKMGINCHFVNGLLDYIEEFASNSLRNEITYQISHSIRSSITVSVVMPIRRSLRDKSTWR